MLPRVESLPGHSTEGLLQHSHARGKATSREETARRQRNGSRSPPDPRALAGWKAFPLPPASTAAPKPLESPTPRLPPSVGIVKKI